MDEGHGRVTGGSRPHARLESQHGSDAGRPGREPGEPTERKGKAARPQQQNEGSFQPGEELRCKCRKEGITLESGPPKRGCLLTPKACEWTLRGSRVFAGDQAKMRSVAWAPRPDKSGDLDTEWTQGDDNVKTREELTPGKSQNPEPPEMGRGQGRLALSSLRRTSLQTAGLGRWAPGCATTEPVVRRPQDANGAGSGVMLSAWTVEEGARAHPPPGGQSAPLLQEE